MAFGRSEILEFDNVSLFKIEMDPATHIPTSIAGLCGRSAYSVYEILSEKEDRELVVKAKIHIARGGESGRFFYKLVIPDDVDELVFGDKKHVLWKRSANPH